MCGICGYIGKENRREDVVLQMLGALKHRGPDNTDQWLDDRILLGHNRLSILDLTDDGNQPMIRNELVIVFNGEIYNYLEIKKELETKYDQYFVTQTDTEIILAAWEVWGVNCLQRFRGMWALAIYNTTSRELVLSRDRFGIKPLYFYKDNNKVLFSSEIKGLLSDSTVPRKANLSIISDFLIMGLHDHRSETFFKGIEQLPPGTNLIMDVQSMNYTIAPYYSLTKQIEGRLATTDDFSRVFEESINLHLRSDVPVGTCLSGGLDSSAVATIAAKFYNQFGNRQFHAVTAQSGDSNNDETEYARQVVQNSELAWHLARPSQEDFAKQWEKCLFHQDEPCITLSVFMQYWVMKTAKEAGLKVMLDGQGGDECLLGYERYYPAAFLDWIKNGSLIKAGKEFVLASQHSKLNAMQLVLYTGYFLNPTFRKIRLKNRLPGFPPRLMSDSLEYINDLASAYKDPRQLQVAEINCFQMPHLLKYEDRNSMAWSIEARVPFVDHEVIETAIALRSEDKIRNGYTKWALRTTMAGRMPDSITWRRNKIGFEAPTLNWLEYYKDYIDEVISRSIILRELGLGNKPDSNEMLIKFFNLACWELIFNVSI